MTKEKNRSRPKIGDIIEFTTPKGLAYAQYTHKDQKFGHLIRILPDTFTSRPERFDDLVERKELFFVFFPLSAATSRRLATIVSNEKIPMHSQGQPLMKKRGFITKDGKVLNWWIWDGKKEVAVERLTEEQKKFSIVEIINDTLLIERIIQGWLPEHDS